MNINKQKEITNLVMDKIYLISPYAIVAGGAPRDWYFGNPARDIDVFLYRPDLITSHSIQSVFSKVGLTLTQKGADFTNHPLYEKNALIYKVFDCKFKGLDFQFIFMQKPTFKSVVPTFPLNICMIWYKNGEIHTTRHFDRAVKHKAIVKVNPLYADGDKYIQKILDKFPGYDYYSTGYTQLADRILDK